VETRTLLVRTVETILKQSNSPEVVKEFEDAIAKDGWPKNITKEQACRGIDMYINEKLEQRPDEELLDTLLFIKKKMPRLTDRQRKLLRRVRKAIMSAQEKKCDHKLHISAFIHGGGFCPPFPMLEVICSNCGLNVTIPQGEEPKHGPDSVGITLKKADLDQLNKWMREQYKNRLLLFADVITENTFGALKRSPKWPGKVPFDIEDLSKFESKSGI